MNEEKEQYLDDGIVKQDKVFEAALPIDQIFADVKFNCRGTDITPATVVELAEDIRKYGLHQPIIVRPLENGGKYKYIIVAGHRRHTACKFLGHKTIEAFIRFDLSDEDAFVVNATENIKRVQLNILQEASVVRRLMGFGYLDRQIRKKLDVSYPWLKVRRELLTLPPEVQEEAANGNLSQAHITELAKLAEDKTPEEIIRAAAKIRDKKLKVDKTVEKIESPDEILDKESKIVETEGGIRFRTHSDTDRMQDLLLAVFKGKNIAARALAWARYQITDLEFLEDVQEEARYMGLIFNIPSEYYGVKHD